MKWNKYTLTTTTEAVDMVSYTLAELGIEGIEIKDKIPLSEEDKARMFIDILPELGPDDGKALVSFYIEPEQDSDEFIRQVQDAVLKLQDFVNVGAVTVEKSQTADVDWINNWKKYWKPFKVDDQIIIKPTWEKLEDVEEGTLVVELDPGTSFGTGMHQTTKLCIAQMKKYLKPGQQFLDVGCGSGILSIIGIMLGADKAAATDIDIHAVEAAQDNVATNRISEKQIQIAWGDIIMDNAFRKMMGQGIYDMVVANILADVIIPLSEVIKENLKPGGIFISSGIIDTKESAVRAALIENGFKILDVMRMGEWVSFSAMVVDNSRR